RRRAAPGRPLARAPAGLLLDDPAAGLDPRARVELRDMVRALAARGKTLLISSHILGELSEMCSGLLIIERGKLLQNGTLEDLARHAAPERLAVALRALDGGAGVEKILGGTASVKTFKRAGAEWRVEIEGGEDAAADLLASLVGGGARVVSFHAHGASLEDIFMNLTKGELA
ncbi:MAG: DUF4162 domain-containing protein, partial [Kiritimatiellaeota bacterium]|nr:DUF4162 domain-containing protein [Kiritimatiellota bacterium]